MISSYELLLNINTTDISTTTYYLGTSQICDGIVGMVDNFVVCSHVGLYHTKSTQEVI